MKYLFLHIPKTAGTSLRQSLEKELGVENIAQCYGRGEIPAKLKKALASEKPLIYGHIDFSHLREVEIPEDYQLLAFIRHPVQRCISTYIHFLNAQDKSRKREAEEMGGFPGFLASNFGYNWQCQYLAGKKNDRELMAQPEKLFAEAKVNFDKLHWVGVTERYLDSLISLQKFMRLQKIPYVKTNLSRDFELKSQLEEKYAEEIIRQNQMDLKLWQFANARLDEQLFHVPALRFKKLRYSFLKMFGG